MGQRLSPFGSCCSADANSSVVTLDVIEAAVLKHVIERTDDQKEHELETLTKCLQQTLVCATPSPEECRTLASHVQYLKYSKGESVCQVGDPASHFFIVHEGQLDVVIGGKVVTTLENGAGFGELALFNNSPRAATVGVKTTTTTLWAVARKDFQDVLQKADASENNEFDNALNSVPLFKPLNKQQKKQLTSAATLTTVNRGDSVFKKGDVGRCLYIVKKGRCSVVLEKSVKFLVAGDCFGERALLGEGKRSAEVSAVSTAYLWCIDKDALEDALGGDLQDLLHRNLILEGILNSDLLSQLSSRQSSALATIMENKTYTAEQSLGDEPRFFVILEGEVMFQKKKKSVSLGRGFAFGEEDLIEEEGVEKKKKVLTAGPNGCTVAELSVQGMENSLRYAGVSTGGLKDALELNQRVAAVRKIYIFRHLSDQQVSLLVNAFEPKEFKKGDQVIKQGDVGSYFFMIVKGAVRLLRDNKEIHTLGENGFFGERALLIDEPRSATAEVTTPNAEFWAVEKQTFLTVIKGSKMEAYLRYRIQIQDSNIKLDDLVVDKELGTGAFGLVKLVSHKRTKIKYALKCLETKLVEQQGHMEMLETERSILEENDHPFILRCVCSFNDPKYTYFLTEVVSGGELYDALRLIPGVLSRSQARFYGGSILLALENLHDRSILFRDLKPENVMLDAQGYIKLIDFGCAKRVQNTDGKAYTVVGTSHYMAPEMIKNKGYTNLSDYWSLGVCMYEFVCGGLPFAADLDDALQVFKAILKTHLKFPENNNDTDTQDIVQRLLEKNPAKRVGSGMDGADEIKQHIFWAEDEDKKRITDGGSSERRSSRLLSLQTTGNFFDRLLGRELNPPHIPADAGGEQVDAVDAVVPKPNPCLFGPCR